VGSGHWGAPPTLPLCNSGIRTKFSRFRSTTWATGRRSALVHFQTEGEMAPTPSCYAVTGWRRTESGRPATNIRFSTATPMAASVCWAAKPRARSRGPISVL
jgi:hypothetical protein